MEMLEHLLSSESWTKRSHAHSSQYFESMDAKEGQQMPIHFVWWAAKNCQIRKIISVEKWFLDNDKWNKDDTASRLVCENECKNACKWFFSSAW